ncbi:uncharacterized protein LOC129596408 [Paramacrobiotus metropolitanus]|uniref:uncharacterized protein LOC129596408 n=1 Tax=Paramacrobiotus metropolitanus TaxID=2943436 RepID=UPI0024457E94|nr:uncharacterized protein LOC129596408 [Paramacrobiotus metropolitanus]
MYEFCKPAYEPGRKAMICTPCFEGFAFRHPGHDEDSGSPSTNTYREPSPTAISIHQPPALVTCQKDSELYKDFDDLVRDIGNVSTTFSRLMMPIQNNDRYCVFYRSRSDTQSPSDAFERCVYFRNTLEPCVESFSRRRVQQPGLPASDVEGRAQLEALLAGVDRLVRCPGLDAASTHALLPSDAVYQDESSMPYTLRVQNCELLYQPITGSRLRCAGCSALQAKLARRKKRPSQNESELEGAADFKRTHFV